MWSPEFFVGIAADLVVGVIGAFLGVLAIYAVAKPRLEFGRKFGVSVRPDSSRRFRVKVRSTNRHLQVTSLTVISHFSIARFGRGTSIPVPLSRSEWFGVRSSRNSKAWAATPRLRLENIAWRDHLPNDMAPPTQDDLSTIFDELDAKLFVTVIASSAVFGVTTVERRSYTRDNFEIELERYTEGAPEITTDPKTIQDDGLADVTPPPPAHPAD